MVLRHLLGPVFLVAVHAVFLGLVSELGVILHTARILGCQKPEGIVLLIWLIRSE